MLVNIFSVPMLIIYAIAYGVTMKIADLLNEHGLRLFKGSSIIFGFLWGIFGIMLVVSHNTIANIILAMNIAFLARNRLDYINHQIASSIIIIAFLFTSTFLPVVFSIFYSIFLIFGSIKDYVDDILKIKNGIFVMFNEMMLYYPIPIFIYCIINADWVIFWVFSFYTFAYNLTKYIGKKNNYH